MDGSQAVPLVVDLDGTLTPTDVFIEDAFSYVGSQKFSVRALLRGAWRGKASLKGVVAAQEFFNAARLPYCEAVLAEIRGAQARGVRVYLATAADAGRAQAIAAHLGGFAGVFASEDGRNLSGVAKAAALVGAFGEGRFDYIGNASVDLSVWQRCREAIVVNAPLSVQRRVAKLQGITYRVLPVARAPRGRIWRKALRVHQYSKNALVFVPLLTSHSFNLGAASQALGAFIGFCAAASAIYLLNDLIDVWADRAHPRKCKRALANGSITPQAAVRVSAGLLVVAFGVGLVVSPGYAAVLAVYVALTFAYSLVLKRKLMVDVVVLALLYTVRVWAGAVAISVDLSNWLLTFSLFFFTCLALIKRYTELALRIDVQLDDPSNRNYRKDDLSVIGGLAAASGMNAVTVFALYVSSSTVAALYPRPAFLWLVCPLLLYLLARMLVMAQRRAIDDDPLVFVLRDRIWRLAILCVAGIFALAMVP